MTFAALVSLKGWIGSDFFELRNLRGSDGVEVWKRVRVKSVISHITWKSEVVDHIIRGCTP